MQEQDRLDEVGKPSPLSCPECGGALYEIEVDRLLRFRCRVGHGYSTQSMLAHQSESLEASLWAGASARGKLVAHASAGRAGHKAEWAGRCRRAESNSREKAKAGRRDAAFFWRPRLPRTKE